MPATQLQIHRPQMTRSDQFRNARRMFRDREAPDSNPGPPTTILISGRRCLGASDASSEPREVTGRSRVTSAPVSTCDSATSPSTMADPAPDCKSQDSRFESLTGHRLHWSPHRPTLAPGTILDSGTNALAPRAIYQPHSKTHPTSSTPTNTSCS